MATFGDLSTVEPLLPSTLETTLLRVRLKFKQALYLCMSPCYPLPVLVCQRRISTASRCQQPAMNLHFSAFGSHLCQLGCQWTNRRIGRWEDTILFEEICSGYPVEHKRLCLNRDWDKSWLGISQRSWNDLFARIPYLFGIHANKYFT